MTRLAGLTRVGATLSPALVFLVVYGSAAGHGFISDDFGWIVQSRVDSIAGAIDLFRTNHGFYRPLVSLSFALNYALFGIHPQGYGWTNLLLALLCGVLLQWLLKSLGLSRGAAWMGAVVWLLNFHGISMAVLWISGRTALLLIAGALVAAIGAVRGAPAVALGGFAFALWSKEEAILIPAIWAAMFLLKLVAPARARRTAIALAAGTCAVFVAYAFLRAQSGAMTPSTAPSYYTLTFTPTLIARNVAEYADRACTFAIAVTLIGWIALRPAASASPRTLLALGAVWLAAGYAITIWIPSRSSLYACFPSVGAIIAASALWDGWWRGSTPRRQHTALIAAAVIPLLCTPICIARNERWTRLADFSQATLDFVRPHAQSAPPDTWIVLVDDRARRVNVQSAFGSLLEDALLLWTGRAVKVWVDPPLTGAALAGLTGPCADCPRIRLAVSERAFERLDGR
ncbi:MAG TPA: hypothetical protein VFK57_13445 [Vicinamibacterales bacterium]|nr:hypothetical protein [Vicinamibacterales bacterium]